LLTVLLVTLFLLDETRKRVKKEQITAEKEKSRNSIWRGKAVEGIKGIGRGRRAGKGRTLSWSAQYIFLLERKDLDTSLYCSVHYLLCLLFPVYWLAGFVDPP
jgi:hypothetical protein